MNPIDRAISWFSPQAACQRLQYRNALKEMERFDQRRVDWSRVTNLAYQAAETSRRTNGWFRPSTSANAEIATSLVTLRDGGRQLSRDNPLAAKALVEFQTKLVGTGIRPQAQTGDAALNKILDDTFDVWARQTRYYHKQSLAARTLVEAGESLLRFRSRRPTDGLVVPFDVQLLEPDYIDQNKTQVLDNGGYIIQGVEYDVIDREVALWIFRSHPGETISYGSSKRPAYQSYRVEVSPASPLEGLSRGYREDRPGQVRGVTWFAPVMQSLWDLNGYEEAERVRKRIEACLAAFVQSPQTAGTVPALGAQTPASDGSGDTWEEFRPGMIKRLRNGESVTIAEPKAGGGYVDYTRRQDRLIAAGLGLLYEILTGDLSQINYSSYRGGLAGLQAFNETLQWHVVIPFCCDTVWPRFVQACIISGLVPPGTPTTVEWCPPPFNMFDRLLEAKADEYEIRIGTSTWDQVVSSRGYDPNKQLAQIAARKAAFEQAGVILDCDPSKTARSGVVQSPEQSAPPSEIGDAPWNPKSF